MIVWPENLIGQFLSPSGRRRQSQQIPSPDGYYSVARIAERWGCSEDKVTRILEGYRGESGFMDLGSAENVRKHKRKYAVIRIGPALLRKIEADRRSVAA